MGEVPPADALTDERDLGIGLHRHLPLDLFDDADDGGAGELGKRRAAVAEDPGVAVVVRADRSGEPGIGERPREGILGRRVARILEVVLDAIDRRPRLRVLDLEPGNHERSRSVRAEDEGDRPLGRRKCEARVVEDVVGVEQDDTDEACRLRLAEQ